MTLLGRRGQASVGRLGFDACLVALFAAGGVRSLSFESKAGLLPLTVCVIGVLLVLWQSWLDVDTRPSEVSEAVSNSEAGDHVTRPVENGSERQSDAPGEATIGWRGPLRSFVWLSGFVFLIWLVGYLVATPIFALSYMLLAGRGRRGWATAAGVAAGTWAGAYLLLKVVLHY